MVASRSRLTAHEIVRALSDLVDEDHVHTDPHLLAERSVDRFKKYSAVHDLFDGPFPCAIVMAHSTADVAAVLAFANRELINVVPRTGGTGTEGGLETAVADTIVLDCSPMNAILEVNETDMMVTAQCGVGLQALEDHVRTLGLTTGHSPQSKPIAQMGGLAATRSIGQFSTLYGAIEDMVVGLEAVLPGGTVVRVKNVPRRAAGPDIRHVLIGNEGALAVITEVTVKLFPYVPESIRYFGFLTDSFGVALEGLRSLVTSGYRPSVARAYSPQDAHQHFADFSAGRNVAVLTAEGPEPLAAATGAAIQETFLRAGATPVPAERIAAWFAGLNWGQDKIDAERATMATQHHLGYTTEVSVSWSAANALYESVMHRIRREFPRAADLTMLGAHSSHSYQTGTNLYFVYDYDIQVDPREEITEYHIPLNAIIVEEALAHGGSMVHHHGVGKYRTPWVVQEHGSAFALLAGLKSAFDPNGIMNLGTLFPHPEVVAQASSGWTVQSR